MLEDVRELGTRGAEVAEAEATRMPRDSQGPGSPLSIRPGGRSPVEETALPRLRLRRPFLVSRGLDLILNQP